MEHQMFVCQVCGEKFTTNEERQQHVQEMHPNEQGKAFVCPICGAEFENQARLELHNEQHHRPVKATR